MSLMPRPRGILTTLSSASGPGASKRCLPTNKAPPTRTEINTSTVNTALPTITRGWRVRTERRFGGGTRSGSSAARGLRGGLLAGGGGGTGFGPCAFGARPLPLGGGLEFKRQLPLSALADSPKHVAVGVDRSARKIPVTLAG